jgi:hypothetical protein
MTDAPERIWIAPWREGDWSEGDWDDNEGKTLNDKPCIEYVRADRIEALEAKLGYYNLLWQAYEGERPVDHLEEAIKTHSAVSDRLAEKLHKKELLLEKTLELLKSVLGYNSSMHSGAGVYNKRIKDLIAEIKGENK